MLVVKIVDTDFDRPYNKRDRLTHLRIMLFCLIKSVGGRSFDRITVHTNLAMLFMSIECLYEFVSPLDKVI